jgi:hydroxyacylglutathione hydrolase
MQIIPVKSPGLAHTSYYFSNKGEAFVVDPRRDVDVYLKLASDDCANIKYVFETHRNEDYVIGSLELKSMTDVKICHSIETPFKYGDYSVADGEKFQVGDFEIECLWTPGHTFDSVCYVLTDLFGCDEPLAVFSGDTLFVGDVGRTDLPGNEHWKDLSSRMYDGLHEKILPLGDHVILFPSHTAGSICGSNISNREVSTIGYEKLSNILLSLSKDEFIENRLNNKMPRPPYFRRMEDWNLNGAPLMKDLPEPRLLRSIYFEKESKIHDTFILDTRQPDAFASSHLPGSVNIWLKGVTYFPGWIIGYNDKILLICERVEDVRKVSTYLRRIGYDNIEGYLCPGIDAWRNTGMPTEAFESIHVEELKKRIEEDQVHVLDVREEHEYFSGHIKGSQNIYVGHLVDELDKVPKDSFICTTCAWGGRGGIAASLLKKKGYRVSNLLGGMHAWKSAELPTEIDPEYELTQQRTPTCPF